MTNKILRYSDDELLELLNNVESGRIIIMDYSNIADVFKTIGFIQRYGVGIQTARNAMIKNGNPEPEFDCNKSIVICILRAKL